MRFEAPGPDVLALWDFRVVGMGFKSDLLTLRLSKLPKDHMLCRIRPQSRSNLNPWRLRVRV